MRYHQGYFKPKNPEKYAGDPTRSIYRSGWELKVMSRFDRDPNVLKWASEELQVQYQCPIDPTRVRRYFPDFVARIKAKDGSLTTWMIEVKPRSKLDAPTPPKGKGKRAEARYLNELLDYRKNESKWKAAREYCRRHGMKFRVLTEKELGIGR